MKKGSVFANKKGPLNSGFGTPGNISAATSSFFDNSLPHMPPNPLTNTTRNWQATPISSHRFPPAHCQQSTNHSAKSIRTLPPAIVNTPTSNLINRAKSHTLQNLVENLNEVEKTTKFKKNNF